MITFSKTTVVEVKNNIAVLQIGEGKKSKLFDLPSIIVTDSGSYQFDTGDIVFINISEDTPIKATLAVEADDCNICIVLKADENNEFMIFDRVEKMEGEITNVV